MNITWKEFKDSVEAQGVLDTDEIGWIDVNGMDGVCGVRRDDDGKWVEIS